MGAKTWMLVYSEGNAREALASKPELDRAATRAFAAKLFPNEKLEQGEDGSLMFTGPPKYELLVGCFPGVSVVAAREFGRDYPSKLPASFIEAGRGGTIHLHCMHSTVDWFAYAVWKDGRLQRSLSVSPDTGIREDIGEKAAFELPFWLGGEDIAVVTEEDGDEYPLPFHPLDMAEAALAELFGYQLEGDNPEAQTDPDEIVLMRFRRSRSWWKIWK